MHQITFSAFWKISVIILIICFGLITLTFCANNTENAITKSENKPMDKKLHKIIGGQKAKPHSLPNHVALLVDNKYLCGGSLISEYYVLTAAHCLKNRTKRNIEVILGAHKIKEKESSQKRMRIRQSNMFIHNGYETTKRQHDIALIELPERAPINKYIKPIRIETNAKAVHKSGIFSGWGLINSTDISNELKFIYLKILPKKYCRFQYFNGKSMLCVSFGPCIGDSGGPLVSKSVQIGVASFGVVGCAPNEPGVFTKVAYYIDWIKNKIRK